MTRDNVFIAPMETRLSESDKWAEVGGIRKLDAIRASLEVLETFARAERAIASMQREQEARKRAADAAWNELRARVQTWMRATKGIREHMEPAPPQDPRERALWLKENRNTGPDRSQYKHRGQK